MIAAGGTGGHVYPALAAAESMVNLYPETTFYFVGTVGGFERPLVAKTSVNFAAHEEVQAGPIHGVNPLKAASSLFKLGVGTIQSFRLLRKYRPEAILSTGGWVSLPVVLSGWALRVPVVIYLPDIEPGLTIKVLRRFAKKVAITTAESAQYFRKGQTVVTGYPLRAEMYDATREHAITHFGLEADRKTLLIFGGSRGARAINIAIGDILSDLLDDGMQVIHVTGELDWERAREQIGALSEHPRYHGYAYLHDDMALAMAGADLVVSRAGASVLGEFPFFQLPSILIPLAYSWRYQQVNADYLAKQGAAIHLDEHNMAEQLLPTIRDLMGDSERLTTMREQAGKLAQPKGAQNLAELTAQLARGDL